MERENYRSEVDGLRAIAVIPVLLFHADPSTFGLTLPGGYLGVDVFFVISGYLIARLIVRDLAQERFSFSGFYERRARRILPALFMTLLGTLVAGSMILPRAGMRHLLESVMSVTLLCSNFYFWRESGYFGEASDHAPLIHTWSLGVEEQFYLLFPLLLWLCWKLGRVALPLALALFGLASVAVAQYGSVHHPVAAFYLLSTRAWELFAGAGLALWEVHGGKATGGPGPALWSVAGLTSVLGAMFWMDEMTPHPSLVTAIPVLGTCLLLRFAQPPVLLGRLLSTRALVYVGLISYPLYLWHQPILALARQARGGPLAPSTTILLLLLSGGMADLTWRFVERPIRKARGRKTARVLVITGGISLGLLLVSASLSHLYPKNEALALQERGLSPPTFHFSYVDQEKEFRGPERSWLILGDSHAGVLGVSLEKHLEARGATLRNLAQNGCPPLPGFTQRSLHPPPFHCLEQTQKVFDIVKKLPPHTIVVTYRAPLYLSRTPFDNGEGGKEWGETVRFERAANEGTGPVSVKDAMQTSIRSLLAWGHRVVLVYPLPELGWNAVDEVLRQAGPVSDRTASVDHARFRARARPSYAVFDALGTHPRLLRVHPEKLFCDTFVKGRCAAMKDRVFLYADDNHLSQAGADLLTEEILEAVSLKRMVGPVPRLERK